MIVFFLTSPEVGASPIAALWKRRPRQHFNINCETRVNGTGANLYYLNHPLRLSWNRQVLCLKVGMSHPQFKINAPNPANMKMRKQNIPFNNNSIHHEQSSSSSTSSSSSYKHIFNLISLYNKIKYNIINLFIQKTNSVLIKLMEWRLFHSVLCRSMYLYL